MRSWKAREMTSFWVKMRVKLWTQWTIVENTYLEPYGLPCFLDLTYSLMAGSHFSSYPSLME
jgi:hypothetical protein